VGQATVPTSLIYLDLKSSVISLLEAFAALIFAAFLLAISSFWAT
jgi:hypothetical protein